MRTNAMAAPSPVPLQLWQERLDQVLAMPEVLSGWGPEQRVQAEQLLCMLASLLAPLGPELCLPATPEGMRSGMKVCCVWPSGCHLHAACFRLSSCAACACTAGGGAMLRMLHTRLCTQSLCRLQDVAVEAAPLYSPGREASCVASGSAWHFH